ncbi:HAD family hydrolase [Mongoliibacter ruber]|uniref:Putative hydrolase of the HAD superfamily n=1 Tax=Mongoliibacter ruber TaxID=1750599 RepID=A0A2T0WEQ5_9BACT|nr:HAD family hydrolase [Mongoliibacter ruber]PRY85135.1 putative hydrolase of the HAD superfamily [Mongoliibacter ruber]
MKNIKVIAFDADDTLWVNEPYFREAEDKFCELVKDYLPKEEANQELFKTEINNLPLYGYGVKGFTLSMIEAIMNITDKKGPLHLVEGALAIGREILGKPIELLENVEKTLKSLNGDYRLVMATKGDLLDQERKLLKSGLARHFHHIEIMSNKNKEDFQKLIRHLDCAPDEFLMVGNSLRSDILPVLQAGGSAVYVPYHITWEHEKIDHHIEHDNFHQVDTINEIIPLLKGEDCLSRN